MPKRFSTLNVKRKKQFPKMEKCSYFKCGRWDMEIYGFKSSTAGDNPWFCSTTCCEMAKFINGRNNIHWKTYDDIYKKYYRARFEAIQNARHNFYEDIQKKITSQATSNNNQFEQKNNDNNVIYNQVTSWDE